MGTTEPTRPICPDCGKEMIFLVTNTGPDQLQCYVCDCRNPHLEAEIRDCRVDPSPDASIAVVYESFEEEVAAPTSPKLAQFTLEFYCHN